jgi:hypothetical protein
MRRALSGASTFLTAPLPALLPLLPAGEVAVRLVHSSHGAQQQLKGACPVCSLRPLWRVALTAAALACTPVTGAAAALAEKLARREGDPLLFHAQLRDGSGRLQSAKLRGSGRTPAVVFNQVRTAWPRVWWSRLHPLLTAAAAAV